MYVMVNLLSLVKGVGMPYVVEVFGSTLNVVKVSDRFSYVGSEAEAVLGFESAFSVAELQGELIMPRVSFVVLSIVSIVSVNEVVVTME